MAHVITQPCCNDATCVGVCPVDCIHPAPDEPGYANAEMLYIDPETCIDCGACIDVCPVEAIFLDYELPEEYARYVEINALHYASRSYPPRPASVRRAATTAAERPKPLRVAIVGAGPAACYAAEDLLSRRDLEAEVHIFERLPTPWGLVRSGVAPDHQHTKAVSGQFERTVARNALSFYLNVEVGKHISHDELMQHHHAVIYANGATGERRLNVPGEDLPGSHSAAEFVGWYNGHPDFRDVCFDFSGERAIVVGNGNVALDVARILVSDVAELAQTDIADHALKALANSRIREVVILGRRGPAQAAYTTPEILALCHLTEVDVVVDPVQAQLDGRGRLELESVPGATTSLKVKIVQERALTPLAGHGRRIVLRYLESPVEILGEDRVQALRMTHNELVRANDGRMHARPTNTTEDLDCGLVLRSVGFRGTPIRGLPFDEVRATLPNDGGRVVDPRTGEPLVGAYAAGWIKRGPSGVIGTNKKCAEDTVGALLDDHASGRLVDPSNDSDALRKLIADRQPRSVDHDGWKAIDRHERKLAEAENRPRVKLVDVQHMLEVAEQGPP